MTLRLAVSSCRCSLVVPAVSRSSSGGSSAGARATRSSFTNLDLLASVVEQRRRRWRSLVPLALFLLALAAASAAVARPRTTVQETSDRATVVLLVDVSGSMRANDVKPTRLLAAAHAMSLFAGKVPKKVKVGLISFSTGPDILVPPTTDRALLQEGIELLEPEGGTAIGDGLGVAVQVVRSAVGDVKKTKDGKIPGAIVLLSDGAQTRGDLTPLQGADRAKRAGIRVFTVALGTNHGTLGGGGFGGGIFGGSGRSSSARSGHARRDRPRHRRRDVPRAVGRQSRSRSTRSSARASPAIPCNVK